MTKKKKDGSMTAASESSSKKKRKQGQESPLIEEHQGGETKMSSRNNNNNIPRKQAIKSKKAAREEAEERRLTALLFGGGDGGGDGGSSLLREEGEDEMVKGIQIQQGHEGKRTTDGSEEGKSSLVFEIDRKGAGDDRPAEPEAKQAPLDLNSKGLDEEENEKFLNSANSRDKNEDDKKLDNGPAWVDEDDDNLEVDLLGTHRLRKLRKTRDESQPLRVDDFQRRLRDRYKSTMQATAQTQWAKVHHDGYDGKPDENDDDQDDVMLSSQPLLLQGKASSTGRLPPNILKIVRCPDANQSDYNKAVVQAVHFHPGSDPDKPLLLTAGLDKTLRFFQVGAVKSEKVHGIHFPKLPIHSASFLGDTGKVVVSGRRPFFYIYDSNVGKLDHIPRIRGREEKSLEKCFPSPDGKLIAFVGNDGYVILVDVQSKQWLANLKLNGSVRAVTFTPDGQYLLTSGSDGDVYRWDLRARKCVEKFANQDGAITSYLAASTRQHLAVGSESGVVNLYSDDFARRTAETSDVIASQREPIKSIMNLQTSADMIRFNHDGQILAMSSRREQNSLKLLHVPTATVFSNWPTSKTPLKYVWSLDFSPQSKFLAIGNDKGQCLLYTLQHYQ